MDALHISEWVENVASEEQEDGNVAKDKNIVKDEIIETDNE